MRLALAAGDVAILVEIDLQFAYHVAVLPRLHDADELAILVGDTGRILALGGQAKRRHAVRRAEQRVRVGADDDVYAAELPGQRQLARVAHMRRNNDLVDALAA